VLVTPLNWIGLTGLATIAFQTTVWKSSSYGDLAPVPFASAPLPKPAGTTV
jgi:hypothetical protein